MAWTDHAVQVMNTGSSLANLTAPTSATAVLLIAYAEGIGTSLSTVPEYLRTSVEGPGEAREHY